MLIWISWRLIGLSVAQVWVEFVVLHDRVTSGCCSLGMLFIAQEASDCEFRPYKSAHIGRSTGLRSSAVSWQACQAIANSHTISTHTIKTGNSVHFPRSKRFSSRLCVRLQDALSSIPECALISKTLDYFYAAMCCGNKANGPRR